ncbi:MAG: hypothetical protein ACE3L7_29425 [Candidatus Pristimantibacillus sp.]
MKRKWIKGVLEQSRKRGITLLLAGDEDLVSAITRLQGSEAHLGMLAEIRTEADRMIGTGDPELSYSLYRIFSDTGERQTYERVYFERRRRLNTFVIMWLVAADKEVYYKAMCNTLWSICGEYTWCLPAHMNEGSKQPNIDLFASETGFALSEILLLTEGSLPSLLRSRIVDEIERRLFRPFLEVGPYGWETADHNWASVCAGSIGSAAIYLMDDADRLSRVLKRVLAAMDCYLSGFGNDGACAEGYSYWQYGFGYYVYFAKLLQKATGGAINLFEGDKVKEIALFQQKCFTAGNTVVNFSDSVPATGIFAGLSNCLYEEYAEVVLPPVTSRAAAYGDDHCARWAPSIRNLLWLREHSEGEDGGAAAAQWPAESHYLADVNWLISRHIAGNGSTYSFAAKGGHNDEPHNHNDIGHFILHADGDAYLADLGSGMYSAKYFGPERYSIWCNGSQGHSVPIIGGKYQSTGRTAGAVVLEAVNSPDEDRMTLEMSAAYGEASSMHCRLERSFVWSKTGSLPVLELVDKVEFVEKEEMRVEIAENADVAEVAEIVEIADVAEITKVAEVVENAEILETARTAETGEARITERFITLLEPKLAEPGQILLQGKKQLSIGYDANVWKPEVTSRSDFDHFGKERLWYTLDFKQVELDSVSNKVEARFIFQFDS